MSFPFHQGYQPLPLQDPPDEDYIIIRAQQGAQFMTVHDQTEQPSRPAR